MKTSVHALVQGVCLVAAVSLTPTSLALDGLTTEQEIQQLYLAYLGRPADTAGMEYWAGEVDAGLITLDQIRVNIVNEQPEYLANYGQLNNSDLTDTVYRNLFNREPDQAGKDYWINELELGKVLPDQLIIAFINGASDPDEIILANKLFIAECHTSGGDLYSDVAVSLLLSAVTSDESLTLCPDGESVTTEADFSTAESVEVAGNGSVTDSNGVVLTVEGGLVESGDSVVMQASTASGSLIDLVELYMEVQSPYYSVHIDGDEDAPGRALLQFPAVDPELRLARIVDGEHFALLPFEPESGVLSARVPMFQNNMSDSDTNIGVEGDLKLVVVRSNTPIFGLTEINQPKPIQLSSATIQTVSGADLCINTGQFHQCYSDDRKILVSWNSTFYSISDETAGVIISEVERALEAYQAYGFSNADIPFYSWIDVQLEPLRNEGAAFSTLSGTILIGESSTNTENDNGTLRLSPIARQNLWHEVFHYLQDFSYKMSYSAFLSERVWWLEATAEGAPSIVDPSQLGVAAGISGGVTHASGIFGIQKAPFTWEAGSAGYITAQHLWINICPSSSVCALTPQEYAAAINDGDFPFFNQSKKDQFIDEAPMEDYLRYLLGASPIYTNTAIPIADNVANGTSIGEIIYARQNPFRSGNFSIEPVEESARISRPSTYQLDISATLESGGAYHARISNDNKPPLFQVANTGIETLPMMLTVDAYPLLYRTGTTDGSGNTSYGDVFYHGGSEDFVIGPISQTLGHSVVRIAAHNNASTNRTLTANVGVVDLNGYWTPSIQSVSGDTIQCLDTTVEIPNRQDLIEDLLAYSASSGPYEQEPEPDLHKLFFNQEAAIPTNAGQTGEITISDSNIALSHNLSFAERYIEFVFYETASVSTSMEFTSLTYHTGQSGNGPLWTLSGTGTTSLDANIQGRDDQGVNTPTVCTGSISYNLTMDIYDSTQTSDPAFPGDTEEGSFTITYYYNFDGTFGFDVPVDPAIPDIKVSGSGEYPTFSWNRSDVGSLVVFSTGGNLFHIVGTDNEDDEFVYIPSGIQYGDYSGVYTVANPQASNPSPAMSNDGTEYTLTINTDDPSAPFALIAFKVNPPD